MDSKRDTANQILQNYFQTLQITSEKQSLIKILLSEMYCITGPSMCITFILLFLVPVENLKVKCITEYFTFR